MTATEAGGKGVILRGLARQAVVDVQARFSIIQTAPTRLAPKCGGCPIDTGLDHQRFDAIRFELIRDMTARLGSCRIMKDDIKA